MASFPGSPGSKGTESGMSNMQSAQRGGLWLVHSEPGPSSTGQRWAPGSFRMAKVSSVGFLGQISFFHRG